MEEANALFVVAEVSIALAGFTGVIAALRVREDWHPLDIWRVVALLLIGFGTLILALVPVALHSLGLSGSALWRASSGLSLAYMLIAYLIVARYQPDRASIPHHRKTAPLFFAIAVVTLATHLLNSLAVLIPGIFGAFFIGLILNLAVGGIQFANILLVRPQR